MNLRNQIDRVVLAQQNYQQRGVTIAKPGIIPFKYENEKTNTKMTDLSSLPVYLLLNFAGGDWIDSVKILEVNDGLCEVLKKAKMHGLRRKVKKPSLRRRHIEKTRAVHSASAIFRYLERFHTIEHQKPK